jgi:hypothetical protein
VAGGLIFGNAFPLSEGCTGTFPEFARPRPGRPRRAAHAPEPMAAPEEALSAEPTPAAGASQHGAGASLGARGTAQPGPAQAAERHSCARLPPAQFLPCGNSLAGVPPAARLKTTFMPRADIEGGSDHRRVEPKLWCQAAFKAFSIHPIKWSSRSGLFRKQTAPAFMARARTLSSG